MKTHLFTTLALLYAVSLAAQAPTPDAAQKSDPATHTAPVAQVHTSDLGFSYSIPSDWEVVDAQPMLPVIKQQETQKASSEYEKKGAACLQIALVARHGDPVSVIEEIAIPFDCFGQTFTDKDLPAVVTGVSEGLKKSFEMSGPIYGAYTLGAHSLWIERASGTYIAHPEFKRTVETVCSVLKKGVVCWAALTADDNALQTFEQGAVTLDGEAATTLVPTNALQKKP